MKLILEEIDTLNESEIIIRYPKKRDFQTDYLLEFLPRFLSSVVATKNGATYKVPISQIYYFDCTDNRTYLYLENDVYETTLKLYQLEEQLENTSFVRIGKSTILNTDFVAFVKSLINGKLDATLSNKEHLIINRSYVRDFRKKFGI